MKAEKFPFRLLPPPPLLLLLPQDFSSGNWGHVSDDQQYGDEIHVLPDPVQLAYACRTNEEVYLQQTQHEKSDGELGCIY